MQQACALPYRREDGTIEFCLITTRHKARWSFPKGSVEKGESPSDAALREADGQPLAFRDLHELRRHAAVLMQKYLPPEEAKHAEIWLKADRLGEDVLRRVPLTVPER